MSEYTKTQLLYGIDVDPSIWATMLYPDALALKAKLAHARIGVLNSVHYMEKDSANITDCVNAIKFNEALLRELKDNHEDRD